MAMSREEAERVLEDYRLACIDYDERKYEAQLITALCADPDAALLEACKRLYDICEELTARQLLDLNDDAVERGTRGLVEGTNKIDLEWARIVIAAAEGENER